MKPDSRSWQGEELGNCIPSPPQVKLLNNYYSNNGCFQHTLPPPPASYNCSTPIEVK